MLGQRESEIEALKAKLDTLDRHHEDDTRHVSVLRQQIAAKEEQAAMLQTDVCTRSFRSFYQGWLGCWQSCDVHSATASAEA